MTALTDDQLAKEFERQVRLCSGVGKKKMLEIVNAQFGAHPEHVWRFYANGSFCEKCGARLGSQGGCRG